MGCTQSESKGVDNTTQNNNKAGGGGGNKNINNANNPNNENGANADGAAKPVSNPFISLSGRDLYRLKASWKAIRRSLEETGILIFTKMFENNSELINLFEKFKSMDRNALVKSNQFASHCEAVMTEMDLIITDIDDAEKSHVKLKKLGLQHKQRGVSETYFKEFREPFIYAVEKILGDRFSDQLKTIYETFIDYAIKTLTEGHAGV